jgi:hypothetical protein
MAAAAMFRNSSWGRVVQLYIWMGSAVKREKTPLGSLLMNDEAPTKISGAVSPIALEIASMVPVKIPGNADGNT